MIRAKDAHGQPLNTADLKAIRAQVLWLDVQQVTPDELTRLRDAFALHPLALEDALEHGHWSRFEQYPQHDFITFRTLLSGPVPGAGDDGSAADANAAGTNSAGTDSAATDTADRDAADTDTDFSERVSLFLYHEQLVTISRQGSAALNQIWALAGRESYNTPYELAYELLDEGAQTFFGYLRSFSDDLDLLEERIFAHRRMEVTKLVFERKHRLAQVRQLAAEAQSAVTLLTRHSHGSEADLIRFRDVQESLSRAGVRLDGLRDSLRSMLDLHLNLQSQRMNEVMKTLTAVSTVFLPLTFLAGVWGMNFRLMPELSWRYGYAMAWGSFILTALGLVVYFRRRRWW